MVRVLYTYNFMLESCSVQAVCMYVCVCVACYLVRMWDLVHSLAQPARLSRQAGTLPIFHPYVCTRYPTALS